MGDRETMFPDDHDAYGSHQTDRIYGFFKKVNNKLLEILFIQQVEGSDDEDKVTEKKQPECLGKKA